MRGPLMLSSHARCTRVSDVRHLRLTFRMGGAMLIWHPQGVRPLQDHVLSITRNEVGGIVLATIFLFIGLAACCLAAIRPRRGVGILVWLGIFTAMYGGRIWTVMPAAFGVLPRSIGPSRPYLIAILTYLMPIPAVLFWAELSLGRLRSLVRVLLLLACGAGAVGVCSAFIAPSPFSFMPYNNVVAICILLPLGLVSAVPSLAKRYLVIPSRILALGTLVLAAAAVYTNLTVFLGLPVYVAAEPLAFAVFILSLGFVAVEKIFADERRLLSIENELAIAREIQNSILPTDVPTIRDVRISAAYRPMTAVAGDFYEFIPVDKNRAGFLIADVSGHGVPAALIAAMIKMAAQSVIALADRPAELLRGLNRMLGGQLRGQFVSAAYLWLDTEKKRAAYSAAGHPPLLHWHGGELERIESNGLLFGVAGDSEYPVKELSPNPGDRFLLYTDGVTEPENSSGDSFGDSRLEQVVRGSESCSPSELSDRLLSEIRRWQPASRAQQDDITLIVIDVGELTKAGPS